MIDHLKQQVSDVLDSLYTETSEEITDNVKLKVATLVQYLESVKLDTKLRDSAEVIRTYDMLVAILKGDVPELKLEPKSREILNYCLGTLSWVLQMKANDQFEAMCHNLRKAAEAVGYVQQPQRRDD